VVAEGDEVTVLEYEITSDDLVAFNLHAGTTDAAVTKQRAISRVGGSVAVLVALTALLAIEGHWVDGLVVGVAAALVFWMVWPRIWGWLLRRNILRLAKAGGLGTPGACRIWVDADGVHEATSHGTSSVTWDGIARIDETASHVFIFIGPVQAYMIPKRVGEAAVREFVAAVESGRSGSQISFD
jgi:hypothetical protein